MPNKNTIKTKDFSVSKEEFCLEYDKEYDLYKTNPIPENLNKYYESEDYISHTDSKKGLIEKLYQRVKKITLKSKKKLLENINTTSEKTILDIGCGTSSFLEMLKKNDWNTIGVEPNFSAKEKAIKKGIRCFNETEAIHDKFSIITLWHVLEHVSDLQKQFSELHRLIATNGKVIIAVPNFKSYDAKFYKEHWAAFDVPRHIWHFSEKAISKLADENNFKLIKTKPMWFDSFYVSLLSEKYKFGSINYFRAFGVGLLSNLKATINSQFSSKIYILEPKN